MSIDRRQFIVAGLSGVSAACYPFFDPTTPWMSVQIPGLVGLSQDESTHGLHVLMIDAERAAKTLEAKMVAKDPAPASNHIHFQKHFPRLIVSQTAFDAGASAAPDGRLPPPQPMVYWNLEGYQATFPSTKNEQVIRVKPLRKREQEEVKPTLGTFGDASWIAHMDKLTPTGKSRVNPACLGADPQSANVAARVYFGGGRLSSFYPANIIKPFDSVVFDFQPKPVKGAYKQVLGMPRLIHQIPSGEVKVSLQPFDKNKPSKTVVLRADAVERRLDVQIKNEPDTQDPSFEHCKKDEDVQVLNHFAALYTLLDPRDLPDFGSLPIPHATEELKCPATDEVIWCPGGHF